MTATVEHFAGSFEPGPRARTRGVGAPWRFALRLARREIRRRSGRTLLVILLIAVPVCGMTAITVMVRTNTDSAAEAFARQFGAADLVGGFGGIGGGRVRAGAPTTPPPVTFPAGTRVVQAHTTMSFMGLSLPDGTARLANVTDLDLNDPIARGTVLLRSGRFPTRAGEALLSPGLARAFHVGVGDTLRLSSPQWSEKVVGIGVRATNWTNGFVALRGSELTASAGSDGGAIAPITLVDLPGHPTHAELLSYPSYLSVASIDYQPTQRAVNWVLVGGIIALAIVGLVISGAFAVGARRQLVTLGQLSANGADEKLLRRTLSLQGLLSGAIGSALGFALGVALLLAMSGQFSTWIHHDPGAYVWSARDAVAILMTGVITATIAAFIPARSAARVPVLTALAGRRPLGTLPKRLVPIGAALFAGGVFVLVLVGTASAGNRQGDGLALSAVFGGLLVLAGACCASSVVVAALGNVGRVVRGAGRVAIRSIVRSRARSAAVVMALAAINAGAVAIGTAVESHVASKARDAQFMPDDTLIVSNGRLPIDGQTRTFVPIPASVESTLRRILPAAQWSTRHAVIGVDPTSSAPRGSGVEIIGGAGARTVAPTRADGTVVPPFVTVVDPAVLQLLGLSPRDAASLQRLGAISVRTPSKSVHTVQIEVGAEPARAITAAVAQDPVRATGDGDGYFLTAAKAQALGLAVVDAGVIIHNPKPLDQAQRASVGVISQSLFAQGPSATMTNIAWSGTGSGSVSTAEVRQIVLGVVVFIALIVLAMSLALSAAETRDERDILVSLGARPSTMRSVSSWKAGLLAGAGALVAIPTGFIPVAVVYLAIVRPGEVAHISFPLATVLELLVLAPLIAAAVAYAGSAIAQAVRPTRMSTFATD
jgi:putative ABC transport system permease protein